MMRSVVFFLAAQDVGAVRKRASQTSISAVDGANIVKGVSYGPIPLKSEHGQKLPHDDFYCDEAEPLWGGRGDLKIIKAMGANTIRLYGNHPLKQHGKFLEAADSLGLGVIPGMSDYPYTQSPDNCLTTQNNCYKQVKDTYKGNLDGGFLTSKNTYHASLKSFILLNEPDLKLGPMGSKQVFKGLLSAFDAVLDAEKEAGVVNPELKFTFTMSFAVCTSCPSQKPALGQMLALRDAMKDPKSVGYEPNNDLWKAYLTRFENSFNTANPSRDMKPLILDGYNEAFKELKMPLYIGEYHAPHLPQGITLEEDLEKALSLTEEPNTLYRGYSFFEWQRRYDKGGSEMDFGMFGLGKTKTGTVSLQYTKFDVWCLEPLDGMPVAVARHTEAMLQVTRCAKQTHWSEHPYMNQIVKGVSYGAYPF